MPDSAGGEREEAEGLRAAIAYYLASPGPAIPHRILGPLTRGEWDRFELIHLAHHLSFAVPVGTPNQGESAREELADGRGHGR